MGLGGIKLADYADPRAIARGVGIAVNAKSIVDRAVRRCDDVTVISARVASASGIADYFSVDVVFADFESRVIDYDCDCPAAARFDGMCKHCVALLTAYFSQPRSFGDAAAPAPRATSEGLARCLEGTADGVPVVRGRTEPPGSIHLDVQLIFDGRFWSLRLSVAGAEGSYVVRDLEAFAHRVQRGAYFSYGKKLAFAHDLAVFDEPSRAVARKVAELFPAERLFGGSSGRAVGGQGKREARLREAELASLLDAMEQAGETVFWLERREAEGWGGRAARSGHAESRGAASKAQPAAAPWHFGDDLPELALRFSEVEGGEGGREMRLSDDILVVRGLDGAFVLAEGVACKVAGDDGRAFGLLAEAGLADGGAAFLAERDILAFCRRALPVIEGTLAVPLPEAWEDFRPVQGSLAFYFDVRGRKEAAVITLVVKAFYGEREVVLASPADSEEAPELRPAAEQAFRDEALEGAALEGAAEFFDGSCTLPLRQTERAGELLYGGLSRFRDLGDVFTTPAFDRLVFDRPPRVSLGLSLAGNLIQMDVRESDLSRDELAALLGAYRRRRHFHRLSDGRIVALGAGDAARLAEMTRDLGVSAAALVAGEVELPTYQMFYLDRAYGDAVRDEALEDYLARFDEDARAVAPPAGLAGVLRPYQVEGFQWLARLASMGFGGILADEMGLGKTVQLIALVRHLREAGRLEGPVLVVCPASLVFNWTDELVRFAPDVPVAAVEGTPSQRLRLLARAAGKVPEAEEAEAPPAPAPAVLVASYDRVRIDAVRFAEVDWAMAVLDEAQYIKNHGTKTTRAVKRLRAPLRFALTGTPVENRLSELWSIFDFLMPGLLGSYERFRERYELGILGGDEEAAARLRALTEPFVLRRLKTDVLADLPAKQEMAVYVPLTGEQRRLYDGCEQKLREDLNLQKKQTGSRANKRGRVPEAEKSRIEVLAELTRLRQIALDPALVFDRYKGGAEKLGAIMELVGQAIDAGRKTLVFSQFTSYLKIIAAELERRGIAFYTITGATPKQERTRRVKAFNVDEVPVFLVSLKAGGTGLNLTGASVVIHADPWWNAAATDQATDRAHRIGQEHAVDVYKVVAKGTIEERIVRLQEAKRDLADSVIGTTGSEALSGLTRERLAALLGVDA